MAKALLDHNFKLARNSLTNMKRELKKKYYGASLTLVHGDSRRTWKVLNQLVYNRSDRGTIDCQKILINQREVTSNIEIATSFNQYFVNVGNSLASHYSCDISYVPEGDVNPKFSFQPVTSVYVGNLILKLKNKSNDQGDGITNKILKECLEPLCSPITRLINLSITSGRVSDNLKRA